MVKGRARTILWHEQGPEEAVYEPGPSSLAFTTVDFGRGKDDTNVIAWILKLCVLQNDAMVRSGGELGSGFYFFSIAAEAFGLGRPTADEMQAYGPALFFAQFELSVEERRAWEATDLQGKLELSSLHWKHEALSDAHPVLPIWVPVMPPEGYGGLPSGFTTPFSQSDAQRKEVLSGALVGMMENRLFVTDAEEFKELSVKGDRNKRKFNMPAAKVEWLRAHCFKEGSDQVLELIKKSHELCNTRPELMLAYGRARLWGSTVDFERRVGPRSKLPYQEAKAE